MLLFTKKGKSKADLILAIWLVLIACHLSAYYLLISGAYAAFPYFLGLEIPMPLLHGPFLFLYVAVLTGQKSRRLPVFLHFIPAAVAYLLLAGFYGLPLAQKVYVYEHQGLGYEKLTAMIRLPIVPSGLLYVGWSLVLLKQHRNNIAKQFSYSEKISLSWLVYLTLGMAAIWLSVMFGGDITTFILVDLFVLFIGYFGIRQTGIFSNRVTDRSVTAIDAELQESPEAAHTSIAGNPAPEGEKNKYRKTLIGDELMSKIHGNLVLLMQTEKCFKDPELNLDELAARLDVSSNILSQVINSVEQRNFYDYINDLRITEFKRIAVLPENNKFTLLSLAFEAGFNSKTTFNRNFRKATGLSPREFCQQEKIRPHGQESL
ncbi:helix-turn-helix domain-containing protein [Taibaiella helva]|uniref:helix-turn-helix domain-containing protein n=1 Tax=Taibaiella helva TaxID=2301235 RepID=UPI0018E567EA|nr:helix-turn-helix domain-containing protein [Taibaiella helva]